MDHGNGAELFSMIVLELSTGNFTKGVMNADEDVNFEWGKGREYSAFQMVRG